MKANSMMATPERGEKRDIVVTRVMNAPVEQVWKAWADPKLVMKWWGPDGFTSPFAEMDFRENGMSLVCMRAPPELGGQDQYNTWTYTRIVPHESIEYTQNFADQDGNKVDPAEIGMPPGTPEEVRNLVTFKSLPGKKTELTATEYDWTVGRMMEWSKMGLEQCLDKMAALFAKP